MGLLGALDKFLSAPFETLSTTPEGPPPKPPQRIELLLHAFKEYMDSIKNYLATQTDPLPPGIERSQTIYYYLFRSERPNFFADDSLTASQQSPVCSLDA